VKQVDFKPGMKEEVVMDSASGESIGKGDLTCAR